MIGNEIELYKFYDRLMFPINIEHESKLQMRVHNAVHKCKSSGFHEQSQFHRKCTATPA